MVDIISIITGTDTSPPVNMQDASSMPHGIKSKLLVGITGYVICAFVSFPVQSYLTEPIGISKTHIIYNFQLEYTYNSEYQKTENWKWMERTHLN